MKSLNKATEDLLSLIKETADGDIDGLMLALNHVRSALHAISPMRDHPIDLVLWVKQDDVRKNDYNPNAVAPLEMKLLETSVAEDGYTQPVVTWVNEDKREIVDGFHRSRVAKESTLVSSTLHGYLPVTTVRDRQLDKSNRMASTIRHNRARGTHSVDAMSEIVLELKARNWKTSRICKELGMEEDEVLRLCQITGLAGLFSDAEFSSAWESDSCSNDDELSFEADYTAITQNTGDSSRIFHTFDKWEAVPAGFFAPGVKGRTKEECEEEFAAFLADPVEFDASISKVFEQWPNSCEHNLTNSSMNRIAWLGQAAACLARSLPSTFRGGFALLSPEQQSAANEVAYKRLNEYLTGRGLSAISMEEALSARDSDLF